MIFESWQMAKSIARTGCAGPRLFLTRRGRAADLRNRSALRALLLLIAALMVSGPRNALAHPMGNFSISHFAGLRIEAAAVDVRYMLDLAEIPTFQEMQTTGIVPAPDDPRVVAYLASKAEALKGGLVVILNGQPLTLQTIAQSVIFPPGAGNLPTMKIGVVYRAPFSGGVCPCKLEYSDGNFPERAGWKEVVASAGPGATVVLSTAASVSRSQELANYPTDLVNSPPQDLSAHLTFTLANDLAMAGKANAPPNSTPTGTGGVVKSNPGEAVKVGVRVSKRNGEINGTSAEAGLRATPLPGPPQVAKTPAAVYPIPTNSDSTVGGPVAMPVPLSPGQLTLEANHQGTPRNSFTDLITSNQWGLWFMLTAALVAAALGGLHALEPGHGKTIVAAYLVGSQGTAAHAMLLGLVVTVTHTAGVYALGLITLYASKYIVPDHLYPWFGIASGLTIAFLGLYMLRHRISGHGHAHGHHHHHGLVGHSHDHGPSHEDTDDHPASVDAHQHSHFHDHDHHPAQHTHNHAYGHAHPHTHEQHHDHPHDAGHSHGTESQFSYRQLVTLGVTGGIVPCPAALVVLLSAISLHRIAFGLYLIVAFSLGLAAVLISIGMITVYARRLLARLPTDGPLINRWLPTASAAAITCLGVGIAAQAMAAMGLIHIQL